MPCPKCRTHGAWKAPTEGWKAPAHVWCECGALGPKGPAAVVWRYLLRSL